MDPVTLGMILAVGGQAVNAGTNYLNQRGQNREQRRRQGIAEPELLAMLQTPPSQAFNTGQDSLMQMLRADPWASSNTALESLVAQQGNPFDTTELFRSLGVMDTRARGGALADVRAGASGLGQRFGTAMARESNNAMSQLLESAAARNAQIGMGSHESAQGRLLQAAMGLGQNAGQSMAGRTGAAQLLMGGDQAQNQQRLSALSLLLGLPMPQGAATGIGTEVGGIGNLIAFMSMMRGMNTAQPVAGRA